MPMPKEILIQTNMNNPYLPFFHKAPEQCKRSTHPQNMSGNLPQTRVSDPDGW